MAILIIFILLLLAAILAILILSVKGIIFAVKKHKKIESTKTKKSIIRTAIASGILIATFGVVTLTGQFVTSTPQILGADGKVMQNSIAVLEKVELNGRKEWISIRGENKDNPILLFLAGGPGGTQMAAVRHDLGGLEKNYVVVNWDQPGAGKSYNAINNKKLTVEMYVDDGIKLAEYLCGKFEKEKIYLIGESWGSALGIFLCAKRPDLFQGFIGTGQMVDFKETEIIDYNLALKLATENGDADIVVKLKKNGAPPYYGSDVTKKSAVYLQYLSGIMAKNSAITNNHYNTFRDIGSPEYGVIDKINFILGITSTFNNVYQTLYDIDLRKNYSKIEVPIYFFEGRHDLNAPLSLMEEYYDILQAPKKEIVWFEHSGHSPWINESEKFVEEVGLRFN